MRLVRLVPRQQQHDAVVRHERQPARPPVHPRPHPHPHARISRSRSRARASQRPPQEGDISTRPLTPQRRHARRSSPQTPRAPAARASCRGRTRRTPRRSCRPRAHARTHQRNRNRNRVSTHADQRHAHALDFAGQQRQHEVKQAVPCVRPTRQSVSQSVSQSTDNRQPTKRERQRAPNPKKTHQTQRPTR